MYGRVLRVFQSETGQKAVLWGRWCVVGCAWLALFKPAYCVPSVCASISEQSSRARYLCRFNIQQVGAYSRLINPFAALI